MVIKISVNKKKTKKKTKKKPKKIPDQPALASGYPQNRIQDSNASSQMYLRRCTTISFRLDKNQRGLAVSVEITPGHTPNGQYL